MYKHPVHTLCSLLEHSPCRWNGLPGGNDISMVHKQIKAQMMASDSTIITVTQECQEKTEGMSLSSFDTPVCSNTVG